MASVLRAPKREAENLLKSPGMKMDVPNIVRLTGIPRSTMFRYKKDSLENTPFWAVCKIMKAIGMTDEDRLKLIRIYSGEKKDEKRTVR